MKNGNINCKNSNVDLSISKDEVVISIKGDFDSKTTPLVHECCKKIQKNDKAVKIVINFDKAGHIDTTAFACIINFIKENLGTKRKVFVTNLHDPEKDLLKILKVEDIIKIVK